MQAVGHEGYDYRNSSFASSMFAQSNGFVADCRLEGSVLGSAERDVAIAEPSKSEHDMQGAVQSGMPRILEKLLQGAVAAASCMKTCTYHTPAVLSLHTMFCTVNVSCCSVQSSHSLTAYMSPCESCLVLHMCLSLLIASVIGEQLCC